MAKLIICCAGRPALNGHKRRTFLWSVEHNCFVHEGKELTEVELNAQVEAVFKKNWDLRPFVKVARFSDGTVEAAAPVEDGSKAKIADLQEKLAEARAAAHTAKNASAEVVAELKAKLESEQGQLKVAMDAIDDLKKGTPAAEPTLEQAIEIVTRLAPERLRKQSLGRKPAEMAVG
jgi:hypothetical protein